MPDEPVIKSPRFQFTLRTLISVMVITAVALGIIIWLGIATAPRVLAAVGAVIGYLLGRPGGPVPLSGLVPRIAWMVVCGVVGNTVGSLIRVIGTGHGGEDALNPLVAVIAIVAIILTNLYGKNRSDEEKR